MKVANLMKQNFNKISQYLICLIHLQRLSLTFHISYANKENFFHYQEFVYKIKFTRLFAYLIEIHSKF
jgi:hypothetical protein